jgi:hypothetical protein
MDFGRYPLVHNNAYVRKDESFLIYVENGIK